MSPHDVDVGEASEIWQTAKTDVGDEYKAVAKDYNRKFGKDATSHFSLCCRKNLFHWADLCQKDNNVCGKSAAVAAIHRECEWWYGPDYSIDEYLAERSFHSPGLRY